MRQDHHGVEIRLAELVAALSLAIDLGAGQPLEHGLHSCRLAVRLGAAHGLDERELADVYYLALLRHLGCTADAHVGAAVFGDEIASMRWFAGVEYSEPAQVFATLLRHVGEGEPPLRRARRLAAGLATAPVKLAGAIPAHCEVGQRLAAQLGLNADVQESLGQVFERWDGRGAPRGLQGEEIARPLRVVLLAQDAQVFFGLGGVEAAVAMARRRAGGAHDPALVERFCRDAPALLADLERDLAWEAILADEPGARPHLGGSALDDALRAIADFADLKAPAFGGHSRGVATVAAAAAAWCRLPEPDVLAVRRAGWLHDLGQVGISAGIWTKAGALTAGERERVRLHPYYAERVLGRAAALAPLGALVGLHHERLDSSGYYRSVPAAWLSPGARILAVAEVYCALTAPRPHRPARTLDAAADELRREVRAGRLDGEAVRAVLAAVGRRVQPARRVWPAGLSEREVTVLRLVARGLSNRQMAARLSISKETVNNHVRHIYEKIGVSTRAAATLFAMQHDLLDPLEAAGK